MKLEPGNWAGPIESSFGMHLVFVEQKAASKRLDLADIRPLVEREVVSEKRTKRLDTFYEDLLKKYVVKIDRPEVAPAASQPGPGAKK
jgi:parvulin-like peptidyl-prolyl isomerase